MTTTTSHVKYTFCIPVFLLAFQSLQAQYFSTMTYTSLDGLPTSELHSVLVDSKGYVWTASSLGISRFDGRAFRNFTVEDGLGSNYVTHLLEDGEGRIWCNHQNFDNELLFSVIDGEDIRKIFIPRQNGPLSGTAYYNPHVNQVWVFPTEGSGLLACDALQDTFRLRAKPAGLLSGYGALTIDPFRDRLLVISQAAGPFEAYLVEKGVSTRLREPPFAPETYYFSLFLPDGRLIVQTTSREALIYDGQEGWMPFVKKSALRVDPPPVRSRSQLFLSPTNRPSVYELTEFSAAYPEGVSYRFFSNAGIPKSPYNLAKAPDGTFWIATREGLIHLFPAFLDFLVREENWFMSDLHAICEDRYGKIWFASYTRGLSFFDGEKAQQAPGALASFNKFLPGSVRDNRGNMLFWLEGETMATRGLLSLDGEGNADLSMKGLIGYYFTRSYDGQLAFGLSENRLALQDPRYEEPRFGKIIGPDQGLRIPNVLTAVKDRQDRLWIGRPSSGLAYYDPVKDTVYNFLRQDQSRDYGVMSSEMDSRGNLWFGTSHGLCFFVPPDRIDPAKFDPATAFHPVAWDVIGTTQVNVVKLLDENTLLVGNSRGLALIDLQEFYGTGKPHIYFFSKEDGYTGLGVEQNAVWIDSKGYVWVASDAGAHRFDPRLFVRARGTPAFSINSLASGNRTYAVSPGKPVRLRSVARYQPLKVFLSAAFDPVRPNHVFFSCKFRRDSAFSAPVSDDTIHFVSPGPGAHTLQVKMMKDGSESGIQELEIIIPRPFFENPWTYALFMLAVVSGVWAFQRNRNQQRMEKNKLQVQAIVNQLNPHFINNALQWVQIKVYKDDEAVGVISRLGENIRLVFKNSREKKAFHSLEEEMKLVENYLFIQKKRFANHLDYELPAKDLVTLLGQVMVPLMQIQIHCENAVEHGIRNKEEKGYVKVGLRDEGDYLGIIVEDSGVGRRKAGEIGSKGTQQGTIMLENLKDIFNSRNPLPIEFHYEDDIFSDLNGEGYGTRVHIRIPKKYRYEFD